MLTPKQNLLECIHGGNPDRYVKQFEAFEPLIMGTMGLSPGPNSEGLIVDEWGVCMKSIPGQAGVFPVHDEDHIVCSDITKWKEQVKIPTGMDNPDLWADAIEVANNTNRDEKFVTVWMCPGIFERLHNLCSISETLVNFYEEPEAVKELIEAITEVELKWAEAICEFVKPDVIFHHDDWGTKQSTFMSLDMFEEFFLDSYKRVYGYLKDHGVQLIVHHSDSYGETLVPSMIELGIDIWQGALSTTNDLPKLIAEYGDKISFMGAIETELIDRPDATEEEIRDEVFRAIDCVHSKTHFIPCLTGGQDSSCYPGVYDIVNQAIDECSKRDF